MSRIEFIRSKLSNFSAHVSGIGEDWGGGGGAPELGLGKLRCPGPAVIAARSSAVEPGRRGRSMGGSDLVQQSAGPSLASYHPSCYPSYPPELSPRVSTLFCSEEAVINLSAEAPADNKHSERDVTW